MTDPATFTAEYRSWQWELVLRYEDGSLPIAEWNESTLGTIAAWYAKNLPRDKAIARYEEHFHKNRRRLTHRREGVTVAMEPIEAVDRVWESLLTRALEGGTPTA